MKIVPQNSKKIISVLGMPHAGTTIVCNIFNSMDNAFCLSEPHWTLLSNPGALRLDKSKLKFSSPDEVMSKIKAKLQSDASFSFAGLKETYRPKDPRMKKYIDTMLRSDIVVFVFREPKAHYNSFKVMARAHKRNPMPLKYMNRSFNSLYEVAIDTYQKGTGIIILLESLCEAGNNGVIQYINDRANNVFTIKGKFKLNPTNYIYGNHKANRSRNIAPANTSKKLLTQEEISSINQTMVPKYKALKELRL